MPNRIQQLGPNRMIIASAAFSRALGELHDKSLWLPQSYVHTRVIDFILASLDSGNTNPDKIAKACVVEIEAEVEIETSAPTVPDAGPAVAGRRALAVQAQ